MESEGPEGLQRPAHADPSEAQHELDLVPPVDPLGLVGSTIDDRYHIEAQVGEGGFGYVYRARHLRWDRLVAVKLFKPFEQRGDEEKLREAFVNEGAILDDLSRKTPSIVRSYDVGVWKSPDGLSLLFTVLEWLEGRTLEHLLEEERTGIGRQGRRWPLERVVDVLEPIAQALAITHKNGIAHRDIKPSNIFLVDDLKHDRPVPKLLDFGIAKVADRSRRGFMSTGHQVSAFSVGYAAPEQFDKKWGSTGPWTDVYALALVCVELLIGRHPVEGSTVIGIITRIMNDAERPTPRAYGVALPDATEAVFRRALAVPTQERHGDVGEFWRDLRASVKRPGLGPRARNIALALSLVALGILVTLVVQAFVF